LQCKSYYQSFPILILTLVPRSLSRGSTVLETFLSHYDVWVKMSYSKQLCFSTQYLIQCVHKRMVRFQKLTRNLFLNLYGQNYTVSRGNCPSFSCATSSSLLMLTTGPRGQFPRWRRSRKRLSVCSVLRRMRYQHF
jgi:hypothetical protein